MGTSKTIFDLGVVVVVGDDCGCGEGTGCSGFFAVKGSELFERRRERGREKESSR